MRVFILYIGIEASDGCVMWVAFDYFGVSIGSSAGDVHCMINVLCWFVGIGFGELMCGVIT